MEAIFQQAIGLTSSFNLWLILTIFAITLIAEFGFSIPYLLETIWLLIGYQIIGGTISPSSIAIFFIISLIGREIGAGMLYKFSGYGRGPVTRLYQRLAKVEPGGRQPWAFLKKHIAAPVVRLIARMMAPKATSRLLPNGQVIQVKGKPFCPSTLNVVLGRFSWLKIPMTVTLGMLRRPQNLVVGVGLFSLAWDGLYIMLGAVGAGNKISSTLMLASTIGGFLLINTSLYFIKRKLRARRAAIAV
jgi:membrane-associated protein